MIFEGYRLVLEHFISTTGDNERVRLEEPLCVQYLCALDGGSANALNEVLERMKQEVLKRACPAKMDEVNRDEID